MATTAHSNELDSLLDLHKRLGPDGRLLRPIQLLERACPMFRNLHWKESNSPNGHVLSAQAALPQVYTRRINQGVPASKGSTETVTEAAAIFAGLSKVDKMLARMSGNVAEYRAQKDDLYIQQSIPQRFNRAVFYDSDLTDPDNLGGLAPRLNSTTGKWGNQILKSGITGSGDDNTSIWLMVSSPHTVYGFVPKGQPGGIEYIDRGEVSSKDENNNEWFFLTSTFEMHAGLAVEDPRYIARLCNIDTSSIVKTGSLLIDDLNSLIFKVPDLVSGVAQMYANRTMLEYLFHHANNKTSSQLRIDEDLETRSRIVKFAGIPIFMDDQILNTEADVT